MSVFDETWKDAGDGFIKTPDGVLNMCSDSRAKMAAAAPEMYRALKLVEREGRDEDRAPCCPACRAFAEHANGCELAAALAKAEGR